MNKQELKVFEELFKVETLNGLIKLTKNGNTTMPTKSMHERCLTFIKYGFEEGIKFANRDKI